MKSQLFKKQIDKKILYNVLKCFNLDLNNFDKQIIYREKYNNYLLTNFKSIIPQLDNYYLKCKSKQYLHNKLTFNRCFTILRHILKACDYKLFREQKYSKQFNKNIASYKIINIDDIPIKEPYIFKIQYNVLVNFD
jgi:hypothetical protein